ncbi:hypothetical protein ACEPAG_9262 [Sanghuangporus baumii]
MIRILESKNVSEKSITELRIETTSVDDIVPIEKEANSQTSNAILSDHERRRKEEQRLIRRVDMRLLPMVFIIFVMNYIDRIAVTTARLKGLEQDLGLSDVQYDTVVAIVYVSYCLAQLPSNMILNRVKRPSWYIGICTVLWGLISALSGVTRDFSSILSCRLFLGFPEAAFYPGASYLLSRWYTRKELAFRSSILYAGLLISNAFGSLLAAGILSGMDGKSGIRGWRWLFIIEGAFTVCIGLLAMWSLPDYPADTRWLSAEEMRLAQARLAEDVGEADQDVKSETTSMWSGVKLACKDFKVVIFSFMFLSQLLGLSFINFFPTLTSTLGFNSAISLLLAAPPWMFATILCLLNAFHADRTEERFFHNTGPLWSTIIGYIIGLSTSVLGGRYFGMFLMASGWAGSCLTLVWLSNTIPRPPAKRAAAIAIVNASGNVANIIGSFAWKASWGPAYHQSMVICMSSLVVASLLGFTIRSILIRENKKLEREEINNLTYAHNQRIEEFARLEGITFDEALARKRGFRYLY